MRIALVALVVSLLAACSSSAPAPSSSLRADCNPVDMGADSGAACDPIIMCTDPGAPESGCLLAGPAFGPHAWCCGQ